MAAFVAPYAGAGTSGDSASVGAMRWDVEGELGDGRFLGPSASRHRVRAALYDGSLGAGARVRPAGRAMADPWSLVGSVPEFAVVLGLRGGDLAPLAGARKLAQVADTGLSRRRDRGDASSAQGAVDSGGGGGPAPLRNASPVRLNIPTLRATVPTARPSPRTTFLLVIGVLAVGMAAWLASG